MSVPTIQPQFFVTLRYRLTTTAMNTDAERCRRSFRSHSEAMRYFETAVAHAHSNPDVRFVEVWCHTPVPGYPDMPHRDVRKAYVNASHPEYDSDESFKYEF